MKKILIAALFLVLGLNVTAQNDPVIMTVAGKEIKKSEFLQVYLKNNNDPKYDKASLDEYMELFKKLRLKVEEAKSLGYDTLPRLVNELKGYRTQLSNPYMIDTAKSSELIQEAYDRMKFEIRASHILIRVSNLARPEDTLKAYNKIIGLRNRIVKGESFKTVASSKGGSEDQSVMKNGGDLGYFSAFQMVYPFETAAYITEVGKVSMPVRTQFGYHIINVTDRRAARGKILTAHIMVLNDKTNKNIAELKINEVYKKLSEGADFKDMAMKHSEDQSTRQKGGVLPYFGTGAKKRMVPEFEEQAFALKTDGTYSKPFSTQYGWHIVQRINLESIKPLSELKREIQAKVNRDSRALQTQKSFIQKLKDQYKFKSFKSKRWDMIMDNTDSTIFSGKYKVDLGKDKVLFQYADQKIMVGDFLQSLTVGQRKLRKEDRSVYLDRKYKTFEDNSIKNYEDSQLEEKYPKFKALMQEFNDGVLFYEVMNENVWTKANKDTTGLKNFYESNKSKFVWGDRTDATILECDSKDIAHKAFHMLKDNVSLDSISKTLNKDSKLNVRISKEKFENGKNLIIGNQKLKLGLNETFESNKKFVVVRVDEFLESQVKELKEARGEISLAYQNDLEKRWMKELAEKYPIIVKQEVLYSLGK